MLVPFEDVLVAFQVKSRQVDSTSDAAVEKSLRRLNSTISQGLNQLKTIKRAVAAGSLSSLHNLANVALPFSSTRLRKIIGVVVVGVAAAPAETPELSSFEAELDFVSPFEIRHAIPCHVLTVHDLKLVADELDTLPDFLQYLEIRERLFSEGRLIGPLRERDLLAIYKVQPDEVDAILNAPEANASLALSDRLYESYRSAYAGQIAQRNVDDRPSYLIDRMIESMHTAIGRDAGLPDAPQELQEAMRGGSVGGYAQICIEMARLSRLERRVIGQRWAGAIQRAESGGLAFDVVRSRVSGVTVVLSARDASQAERRVLLYGVASIAYVHLGVTKVVGIATESRSAKTRSYDGLLLQDVEFSDKDRDELKRRASEIFGPTQRYSETEFRPVARDKSG